jgi:glycosyltransferase involved in cell wall biosynthesis
MRIAQIAPLFEDVPPPTYGGTERVIAGLCDALSAVGHDVTLFATASSQTSASLEPVVRAPLRLRMDADEMADIAPHLHLRMLADVAANADEFDIIHSHLDLLSLPFAGLGAGTPMVVTLHGRLDLSSVQRILPMYPEVAFVSISDSQRLPLDGEPIEWAATVPNGLDLGAYFAEPRGAGDYLAFVGRICPEKRPDLAIEIAVRSGWPLRIAAKVDPTDEDYFRDEIKPLLREQNVEYVGELCEADKPAFYAGAAATLFPSDWPEPFGLVLIESLAAGTPVVALRRGAVPEVIEHEVSGYVCDDVDDMADCLERAIMLDHEACRARAADFSVERMRERYERVYETVLASLSR